MKEAEVGYVCSRAKERSMTANEYRLMRLSDFFRGFGFGGLEKRRG